MTNITALAQEIVKFHEDIDSGADIPVHIYKMARDALFRLTASSLPEDCIAQATKLLRERIPLVLKFESGAAYAIMVGVEDLARDVLALASPAPPLPEDIAGLIIGLEARAHERARKNSMVAVEQLLEWQAAAALRTLTQRVHELEEIFRVPLPMEINALAMIIDRHLGNDSVITLPRADAGALLAALRTLAQKNEKLKALVTTYFEADVIGEMNSEADAIAALVRDQPPITDKAVRTETIEECLETLVNQGFPEEGRVCKSIRALAHASTSAGQDERTESDPDLPTAEDVRGVLKPESKTESEE